MAFAIGLCSGTAFAFSTFTTKAETNAVEARIQRVVGFIKEGQAEDKAQFAELRGMMQQILLNQAKHSP